MSQDASETPGDNVISCQGVVKRFGSKTTLAGINLDVRRGETMVVMGASGCGKSTLLKHMIGSMKPDEGRVLLFGSDLCRMSEDGLDDVRKRFGILFQSGALFNSMTIAENVALPLREHSDIAESQIRTVVTIKLEMVGLREHAQKYPSEISGGMKKRAGLARALALDPEILFYDEPSAGLDPVTSAEIDQLIVSLSRDLGVTSVVVTHEMDSAFTIAHRMCMLDRGRVLRVAEREWFDRLRRVPGEQISGLTKDEQLIRQFLRGEAHGPLSERRSSSSYEEEILGLGRVPDETIPSVESTRR
ncbi:MAG: ABC transporter ATP-binding protein [Planctomycetota bacterium]|nr:ABC transporter ATP-binding protein [Planctomycetota bacterium]